MFLNPDENNNIALNKYEAMLKSNRVVFFDSTDFEKIIHHYLDHGQLNKAKKAVSMGLSQHPSSINLKLFNVENLVSSKNPLLSIKPVYMTCPWMVCSGFSSISLDVLKL